MHTKHLALLIIAALTMANCKRSKGGSTAATAEAGQLTPDKIEENKAIAVGDLKRAYFAWNGRTVSVYGYPSYMADKGAIAKDISLAPAPFSRYVLSCELVAPVTETTGMRDKPMVLKGIVKDSPYDTVNLGSCQVVSSGETATVAPTLGVEADKPMNAAEFVKTYNAWKGKRVTVSGSYHSTTTSTTAYGKTIRVDLTDAQGNKAVGAEFAADPSDKLVNNRDGVQVKCTIKGTVFETVNLADCQLINR